MLKFFKIIFLALLIVLVIMALIADKFELSAFYHMVNFSFYIRMASLLGLMIAVFTAWGFKRRIETSQKYHRADQMISEAEATAKRLKRKAKALEDQLHADYQKKSKALSDQLDELKTEHQNQLMALKTQNVRLKEEVSKLMHSLKKNQGQGHQLPQVDQDVNH